MDNRYWRLFTSINHQFPLTEISEEAELFVNKMKCRFLIEEK